MSAASTSTLPSRTRSLRKPSDASHSSTSTTRYGRPAGSAGSTERGTKDIPNLSQRSTSPPPRSSQSPSRLPVKPITRSATISSRPPSSTESNASNTSMRPPSSRTNVTKPNASAAPGLQRSTSIRTASDASQSSTTSSLQRSVSTRRPSASSNATTAPGDPAKQDRSRPPLTQYKHLRNASTSSAISTTSTTSLIPPRGHARTKSTSSTLLSNTTTLRPPSRDTLHQSTVTPNHTSQLPNPAHRKATFSTYNQHFSPAKSLAPKPPSASFLVPPSPSKLPSNIAISAETAKLQNELLQLHLLHKDSTRVRAEWEDSARRKLERRFEELVHKNTILISQERQEMGIINAAAFARWSTVGVPGLDLPSKVRMLDDILAGVWILNDSSGSARYTRLTRTFTKYLDRVQEILDDRETSEDGGLDDEVVFITPLHKDFKEEHSHIERKLKMWRDDLESLGDPDEITSSKSSEVSIGGRSTLSRILMWLKEMIHGMLNELSALKNLEDEIVRREEEWIRMMIHEDDDDDGGGEKVVAGAVWRRM